jgi:hypothetical protein
VQTGGVTDEQALSFDFFVIQEMFDVAGSLGLVSL